jgi:hypothetical protein
VAWSRGACRCRRGVADPELFINRIASGSQWTWISEVFLIAALLVHSTLWGRSPGSNDDSGPEHQRLMIRRNWDRRHGATASPIPTPLHGISWHAVMEPAGQIMGIISISFHWADRMCVVLADVSGKGVPAAVFVSDTRRASSCGARAIATSHLLTAVSEVLLQDGRGNLYVTCAWPSSTPRGT